MLELLCLLSCGCCGVVAVGGLVLVAVRSAKAGHQRRIEAEEARIRRAADDETQRAAHAKWKRERYARHVAQWGQAVADAVEEHTLCLSMPAEALRLCIGVPDDVDQRVSKTKTVDTWKYEHAGGNRYGLRVFVEDGLVTGWDDKR